MSAITCGNRSCGRPYEDTSSGRHNHKAVHGHAPHPERPVVTPDPFGLDDRVREREAAERAARRGGGS